MAHILYTPHHLPRREVAFAIGVVLVMAWIVWAAMVFGERPAFPVDWDGSRIPPPASKSIPTAGCAWLDWVHSSRPIGITELPGRLGGKQHDRSPAVRTSLCD